MISIDERLRVPGMKGVFAMGDVAVDPEKPLGPLAQAADQQGKVRRYASFCPRKQVKRSALHYRVVCVINFTAPQLDGISLVICSSFWL